MPELRPLTPVERALAEAHYVATVGDSVAAQTPFDERSIGHALHRAYGELMARWLKINPKMGREIALELWR